MAVEKELTCTQGTGKKHRHLLYRYINSVPLVDAADPLEVNWVGFSIANDKGEITYRTAFITNHLITEHNVEDLVKAARSRCKFRVPILPQRWHAPVS